jgi:hypothetical protein
MANKSTGKRELTCPVAQRQDKQQELRERNDHAYKMDRAEEWVSRYAPKGSEVQSVNQRGFYYHKPGQIKSEFTQWLSI